MTEILHAYAAYAVLENHLGDHVPCIEETLEWFWWLESATPDAEAKAQSGYDQYAVDEGDSVTQYRIELPDSVDVTDAEAIADYVDDLEWNESWLGAPIVRQNDTGRRLDVAIAFRRAEHERQVAENA